MEFQAWPKTPRLNKPMIVTEKIDGTNAAIIIEDLAPYWPNDVDGATTYVHTDQASYVVGAQSRKRFVTPDSDNFGFAGWVERNAARLVELLGPGRHFGEWWGKGIQRGYGQAGKRFSLFNVDRYPDLSTTLLEDNTILDTVPVLYRGPFSTRIANAWAWELNVHGSQAAQGFMRPEGVVAFHTASRQVYKAFCDPADEAAPKGAQR